MRRHGGARSIITCPLSCCLGFQRFQLALLLFRIHISMVGATAAVGQISGDETDAASSDPPKLFVSGDGAKTGDFSSPNFPSAYPENARTVFQFRAAQEEVVWIMWGTFVLEEPFSINGLCMRDYVEVIVIDYHNVQHVSGRYCGTNKPPDFKTMQQSVDIIFQSSYTKHFQGFNGTYKFIHESNLPAPDSRYEGKTDAQAHGCGGIATGYGGVIRSPLYPDTYPEKIECNWVIRVDPNKKVYVRVLELQLTTKSKMDCAEAQLSVIDGYAHYIYENNTSPHEKHMVRFCGEDKYYKEEGARSYMSTRNRMVVRFNTTQPPPKAMRDRHEEYGSPVGFYLVWTEVLPLDEKGDKTIQCDKFLCRGGDYCLDETQTVCAERRRYCIDKSLLCDGVPNCAELDDSDEENCYSKEIVAAGASLFLLLVLIIVAVICCQRRRGRKQLEHIRRAAGQTSRASTTVGAAPLNAVNSVHTFSSEDTQLLRSTAINKLDANSSGQRIADITAFPQNYHPARSSTAIVEDHLEMKQPFLSVPNHVPTFGALPAVAAKPQSGGGRREKVVALPSEETAERASEGGSILRRRQGGSSASTVSSSSRLPLIKVMSAPEHGDVWEEQGETGGPVYSDRSKKASVDTSTVTWSYEPKPIPYSPTPAHMRQYDPDRLEGSSTPAGAVEMVTFNTASKPTAVHRAPIKPQGILKSSSSLPSSEARETRSASCIVVSDTGGAHAPGKKISVPAPPPQVPPISSNSVKPPPPSYSQALARLGRQKAVEFVDELPRRRDAVQQQQQQQSSLPPLMLSPPTTTPIGDDPDSTADDRSPSPWHRLKPSVV